MKEEKKGKKTNEVAATGASRSWAEGRSRRGSLKKGGSHVPVPVKRAGAVSGNENEKKKEKNERERKDGRIPEPGRKKGAPEKRRGRRHIPKRDAKGRERRHVAGEG